MTKTQQEGRTERGNEKGKKEERPKRWAGTEKDRKCEDQQGGSLCCTLKE
jgi:hypothetical protein